VCGVQLNVRDEAEIESDICYTSPVFIIVASEAKSIEMPLGELSQYIDTEIEKLESGQARGLGNALETESFLPPGSNGSSIYNNRVRLGNGGSAPKSTGIGICTNCSCFSMFGDVCGQAMKTKGCRWLLYFLALLLAIFLISRAFSPLPVDDYDVEDYLSNDQSIAGSLPQSSSSGQIKPGSDTEPKVDISEDSESDNAGAEKRDGENGEPEPDDDSINNTESNDNQSGKNALNEQSTATSVSTDSSDASDQNAADSKTTSDTTNEGNNTEKTPSPEQSSKNSDSESEDSGSSTTSDAKQQGKESGEESISSESNDDSKINDTTAGNDEDQKDSKEDKTPSNDQSNDNNNEGKNGATTESKNKEGDEQNPESSEDGKSTSTETGEVSQSTSSEATMDHQNVENTNNSTESVLSLIPVHSNYTGSRSNHSFDLSGTFDSGTNLLQLDLEYRHNEENSTQYSCSSPIEWFDKELDLQLRSMIGDRPFHALGVAFAECSTPPVDHPNTMLVSWFTSDDFFSGSFMLRQKGGSSSNETKIVTCEKENNWYPCLTKSSEAVSYRTDEIKVGFTVDVGKEKKLWDLNAKDCKQYWFYRNESGNDACHNLQLTVKL